MPKTTIQNISSNEAFIILNKEKEDNLIINDNIGNFFKNDNIGNF